MTKKCNYESLFCMVLLKAVAVILKARWNVTFYTAHVSSTFCDEFCDEQKAERTRECAKSGQ